MSGPYNSYGGQQYDHPEGYGQGGYNSAPPQHGGYSPQPPPPHQQQYSGYPDQGFAPPARTNSFGPPQHGGFQHGQAGFNYGAYDASNPQGHASYYDSQSQSQSHHYQQQPPANAPYNDAYAQNQAYQASMASSGVGAHGVAAVPSQPQPQQQHDFAPQSSDPNAPNYDPNAPPMSESDRGLLGSLGGGIAGHMLGKRADHGFLGTVGGAILGSLTENIFKDKKHSSSSSSSGHHHHHHSSSSSHHGAPGSSWGGSRW